MLLEEAIEIETQVTICVSILAIQVHSTTAHGYGSTTLPLFVLLGLYQPRGCYLTVIAP